MSVIGINSVFSLAALVDSMSRKKKRQLNFIRWNIYVLIIFTVDCDDDCEIIFEAKYERQKRSYDDDNGDGYKDTQHELERESDGPSWKKIVKNAYFGLNFGV